MALAPDPYFSSISIVLFIAINLREYVIPIFLIKTQPTHPNHTDDHFSYLILDTVVVLSTALAFIFRYMNWGTTSGALQYFGLVLLPAAQVLRERAVLTLGRSFSRTVQIKAGQRLITEGPYRWFRHPAYTSMVIIYTAFALSLGTWLGAVVVLGLMLVAIMYHIDIEEELLIATFGIDYQDYIEHTWKLFPGWQLSSSYQNATQHTAPGDWAKAQRENG